MMIDLPTRMVRMAGKAVGFGMILAALERARMGHPGSLRPKLILARWPPA